MSGTEKTAKDRTAVADAGRTEATWEIEPDRQARARSTEPPGGGVIGTRARKVDGPLKATGRLLYTDDIVLPQMPISQAASPWNDRDTTNRMAMMDRIGLEARDWHR